MGMSSVKSLAQLTQLINGQPNAGNMSADNLQKAEHLEVAMANYRLNQGASQTTDLQNALVAVDGNSSALPQLEADLTTSDVASAGQALTSDLTGVLSGLGCTDAADSANLIGNLIAREEK